MGEFELLHFATVVYCSFTIQENQMNGLIQKKFFVFLLLLGAGFAFPLKGFADEPSTELKLFQGSWTVIKLIEDGNVIAPERFAEVLPSGGKMEIVDNSLLFEEVQTGHRHARTISIDPTRYPSTIDIKSAEGSEVSQGIYRFENGRLIVCLGDSLTEARPTELAAPKGSGAMLMVLERHAKSADSPKKADAPRKTQPAPAAAAPTDEEISKMLPGIWRIPDQLGFLHIRFRTNGTFASFRVYEEIQLFRRALVEAPISSGSWEVRDRRILANIGTSADPGRTGTSHLFTIKAMTATEFIFIDGLGRTNKAIREAPAGR